MRLLASKSLGTGCVPHQLLIGFLKATSDEERGACTPAGSISVVLVLLL